MTPEMSVLRRDFMPDDLLPILKANRMDGCVAVQADQSVQETTFLLELARTHREIKGVVGWVDLCADDLPRDLERLSQFEKLRDFRHIVQSEPDDRFLLKPAFCRGIGNLEGFGFTYDILIYTKQLPAAIELVAKFPRQRFVLDHLAKPHIRSAELTPWNQHIRTLASGPNVYCKISGLLTEADWRNWQNRDFTPYLDVVFDAFGCARLMFGSDWPACLLAGSYSQVGEVIRTYTSSLSLDQQAQVFGLNALDCYRLKGDV